MRPPAPRSAVCSGTNSLECHEWTATHWGGEARRWKSLFEDSSVLNCGLVRQNCLLISRNTRMEQMLRDLGVDPPLKGVFDPPGGEEVP